MIFVWRYRNVAYVCPLTFVCKPCTEGRPEECLGKTKDKTWCDNQHREKK